MFSWFSDNLNFKIKILIFPVKISIYVVYFINTLAMIRILSNLADDLGWPGTFGMWFVMSNSNNYFWYRWLWRKLLFACNERTEKYYARIFYFIYQTYNWISIKLHFYLINYYIVISLQYRRLESFASCSNFRPKCVTSERSLVTII